MSRRAAAGPRGSGSRQVKVASVDSVYINTSSLFITSLTLAEFMETIPASATTSIELELHPIIRITDATPPKPQPAHRRLLYRGALSLPDSHLLLDGLTFSGYDTNKSTPGLGLSFLENPLALALESMRGRRTLRFLGVVSLSEGWVDYSGGVQL